MDQVFLPYTFLESEISMKLLLTFLTIAFFSFGAGAMDKIDCSALKNEINRYFNQYLIFEKKRVKLSFVPIKDIDRDYVEIVEEQRNYSIELAFQFSTIYQAVCKN